MLRSAVFRSLPFLPCEELTLVETMFCESLSHFKESQIAGRRLPAGQAERQIRSSQFMIAPGCIRAIYVPKIIRAAALARRELGLDDAAPGEPVVEVQMTISSDGDFFRRHNDSTDAMKPERQLSFVHYLHREPKRFSGGELVLEVDDQSTIIEPERNLLIIFPSILKHEVRLVGSGAQDVLDQRITVNGWVHGLGWSSSGLSAAESEHGVLLNGNRAS